MIIVVCGVISQKRTLSFGTNWALTQIGWMCGSDINRYMRREMGMSKTVKSQYSKQAAAFLQRYTIKANISRTWFPLPFEWKCVKCRKIRYYVNWETIWQFFAHMLKILFTRYFVASGLKVATYNIIFSPYLRWKLLQIKLLSNGD